MPKQPNYPFLRKHWATIAVASVIGGFFDGLVVGEWVVGSAFIVFGLVILYALSFYE